MRKLIIALLAALPLAADALTGTLYAANDGTSSYVVLRNGNAGPMMAWNPNLANAAYSPSLPAQTITGTVTFQIYGQNAGTATLYFGYSRSGTNYPICSSGVTVPANGIATVTCAAGTVNIYNGDQLYYYFVVTGGAAWIYVGNATYPTYVQFTTTLPTTCTCGNDCGGSGCGSATITGAWYSGSATCNCGSSCNGTPAAPGSFTCSMQGGVVCSWGATSGANYVLSRDGSQIYTGNSTSYTDVPSPGAHAYSVYGTGYCASNATGITVGTTNPNTATATTIGSKAGAIVGCW